MGRGTSVSYTIHFLCSEGHQNNVKVLAVELVDLHDPRERE